MYATVYKRQIPVDKQSDTCATRGGRGHIDATRSWQFIYSVCK